MSRRATVAAVILALALGCALGRATAGASRPAPGPSDAFLRLVPVQGLTEAPSVGASPSPVAEETGSDATGEPLPEPRAALPLAPAPTPMSKPALTGVASWYCLSKRSPCTVGYGTDSLVAAAGPALQAALGPGWRGATVRVCSLQACVSVALIDVCRCLGTRIVDLYAGAFAQLAPLGRGLVTVEVRA